jgi:hypothetical protein
LISEQIVLMFAAANRLTAGKRQGASTEAISYLCQADNDPPRHLGGYDKKYFWK